MRSVSQVLVASEIFIGLVQAQSASMLTGRLQALKNIALAIRPRGIMRRIVDFIGFPPDVVSGSQGFQLRPLRPLAAKPVVADPSGDQVERPDEPDD